MHENPNSTLWKWIHENILSFYQLTKCSEWQKILRTSTFAWVIDIRLEVATRWLLVKNCSERFRKFYSEISVAGYRVGGGCMTKTSSKRDYGTNISGEFCKIYQNRSFKDYLWTADSLLSTYTFQNIAAHFTFKVRLCLFRKNGFIRFSESPLKMMNNTFVKFHRKSSFRFQDI